MTPTAISPGWRWSSAVRRAAWTVCRVRGSVPSPCVRRQRPEDQSRPLGDAPAICTVWRNIPRCNIGQIVQCPDRCAAAARIGPATEAHSQQARPVSRLTILGAATAAPLLLAAATTVVLKPSGDIAAQQRDLIVISTVLMLLIIVPVIALTLLFRLALPPVQHARPPTSPTGTTRPASSW